MLTKSLVCVVALPLLLSACASRQVTSLPASKSDHTTEWWEDRTNYGPRQHYVHVVRSPDGQLKDVYRYYLNADNKPILDGERLIYRWKYDAGVILEYRNGLLVRRSKVVTTGGQQTR